MLRGSTRSNERERLLSFSHEAAKEHGDVGVGGLGRLPEDDVASSAGRPVGGDRHDVLARLSDESTHHLGRIDGCCRGADEGRRRPVPSTQPAEPPKDERDVCPEDAAVAVRLIDDDVPQATQEGRPRGVVRQDGRMEHVGIREHHRRVVAGETALIAVGVTVQCRDPPAVRTQRPGVAQLVVREGLRRGEIQRRSPAETRGGGEIGQVGSLGVEELCGQVVVEIVALRQVSCAQSGQSWMPAVDVGGRHVWSRQRGGVSRRLDDGQEVGK